MLIVHHEKYLKTTVFGLNACSQNYAVILVGANMGVLRMTKEHFLMETYGIKSTYNICNY